METSLSAVDKEGHPNLTVSGKLREKENFIFGSAPNFYSIPDDDRCNSSKPGAITKEDLEEFERKEKRKKEKARNRKKNRPTVADVRERLKLIAKYHKKEVEDAMPCPYPLLGPAGDSDSDDSDDDMGADGKSRTNKKCENSDVKPIPISERNGRKKKSTNKKTNSGPPKKRGRKTK